MEITKEIATAWIESYERMKNLYDYYLEKMDSCSGNFSEQIWENSANEYRREMRGMEKTLEIFGYMYDGTEITKKD